MALLSLFLCSNASAQDILRGFSQDVWGLDGDDSDLMYYSSEMMAAPTNVIGYKELVEIDISSTSNYIPSVVIDGIAYPAYSDSSVSFSTSEWAAIIVESSVMLRALYSPQPMVYMYYDQTFTATSGGIVVTARIRKTQSEWQTYDGRMTVKDVRAYECAMALTERMAALNAVGPDNLDYEIIHMELHKNDYWNLRNVLLLIESLQDDFLDLNGGGVTADFETEYSLPYFRNDLNAYHFNLPDYTNFTWGPYVSVYEADPVYDLGGVLIDLDQGNFVGWGNYFVTGGVAAFEAISFLGYTADRYFSSGSGCLEAGLPYWSYLDTTNVGYFFYSGLDEAGLSSPKTFASAGYGLNDNLSIFRYAKSMMSADIIDLGILNNLTNDYVDEDVYGFMIGTNEAFTVNTVNAEFGARYVDSSVWDNEYAPRFRIREKFGWQMIPFLISCLHLIGINSVSLEWNADAFSSEGRYGPISVAGTWYTLGSYVFDPAPGTTNSLIEVVYVGRGETFSVSVSECDDLPLLDWVDDYADGYYLNSFVSQTNSDTVDVGDNITVSDVSPIPLAGSYVKIVQSGAGSGDGEYGDWGYEESVKRNFSYSVYYDDLTGKIDLFFDRSGGLDYCTLADHERTTVWLGDGASVSRAAYCIGDETVPLVAFPPIPVETNVFTYQQQAPMRFHAGGGDFGPEDYWVSLDNMPTDEIAGAWDDSFSWSSCDDDCDVSWSVTESYQRRRSEVVEFVGGYIRPDWVYSAESLYYND